MNSYVVIASKGRAKELYVLMDFIQRQSRPPKFIVIAGTEASDIAGVNEHPFFRTANGLVTVSPRKGSSAQRNYGIEVLQERGLLDIHHSPYFCAFFDDDFRMADDWLEKAGQRFTLGDVAGLTGMVLGDGVTRGGYTEDRASAILSGKQPPDNDPCKGEQKRSGVYGCNMAFRDDVIRQVRFDENTPLYAWQEDADYSGNAKRFGKIIYFPDCRGVHLGSPSGGRVRGVRFGYSQIANPVYFMRKGTMEVKTTLYLLARAITSNIVHTIVRKQSVDYPGRLYGNTLALMDILLSRMHPKRILSL